MLTRLKILLFSYKKMMLLRIALVTCGLALLAQLGCNAAEIPTQPPNIIIILADDMGWDDASFHNSNLFLTPNIDALAYNGVILNQFHTPSLCTPSRSALMTGKFPIHIGMQRLVILEAEPWGLPTSLKILPQYLNDVGYESHHIGKWHLGFFEKKYTPIYRGFKTSFGFWQGHHDYFTHITHETFGDFLGYDFRENLSAREDLKGMYTSDLLESKAVHLIENHDTSKPLFLMLAHIAPHAGEQDDPLQAPEDVIERFSYIPDEKKRKYAAMVSKLDDCVGSVIKALSSRSMLENSIIMFMSDNGAPTIGIHANSGSNYPQRSQKGAEFEGGTRVPAVIWSPLFKKQQRVSNMMMHMVDVLPTLCTAAGVNPEEFQGIDGISMLDTLTQGSDESPRTEYPYTINLTGDLDSVGAVRVGDWKFYHGDINGISEKFLWPGDQYEHSQYEKYYYDTVQIIHSPTNIAFVNLLKRSQDQTTEKPLDEAKILQLRAETKIECPNDEDLPKCEASTSCLLNLKEDPCERYDYSNRHPEQYEKLKQKYEQYRAQVVEPLNKDRDVCANPDYWRGLWVPWYDYKEVLGNISVKGKSWKSVYLYAFVWHYRHCALYSSSWVIAGLMR